MTLYEQAVKLAEEKKYREIDVLFAEKIFGLEVINACCEEYPEQKIKGTDEIELLCDSVPSYSTDIAAAWEVVEKVLLTCKFFLESEAFESPYWVCELDDDGRCYQVFAQSAPLAICLAALKALEEA